jgi:hypothetical protein
MRMPTRSSSQASTRSAGRMPNARRVTAAGAVVACLLLGAIPASAGGGEVGSPQPELAHFNVGPTGGTGTGAVLANGNIVLATPSASGDSIRVCIVHPGGRACASVVTLNAYRSGPNQDSFSGTVEVLATGPSDISIVAEDCCYLNVGGGSGGAVVFDSTDGGTTFGAETPAGTIQGVGAGTYADGDLVVGTYSTGSLQVQSFAPSPLSAATSIATPRTGIDGSTSLTTYNNGVLVASDDTTNTHVEYATSSFNANGSYASVGTFPNELVTAVSGNALLTDPGGSLTGGERLRFFNGHSFGAAYKVPDSKLGDDGYFTMQEVGRVVHVFFIGRRYGYDAFEESTTDGVHWSGLEEFTMGSAISASDLSPVLGPTSAGLLFENDGTPLFAQPVLNTQTVHVALAAVRLKVGHTTTLHGTASPRLAAQTVTLQRLVHGEWYPVATTKESAAGAFVFKVSAVTRSYRAVVNEKPGYYEYGYSNAVTLVAVA